MTDNHAVTTELLLAMTAEEFEKTVVSQLNRTRRDAETYEALMSARVITRAKETLDILRVRSQDSMQAKRTAMTEFQSRCAQDDENGKLTWLRGKGEYAASIRRAGHFLKLVEAMQVEVKQALKTARVAAHDAREAENAGNRTSKREKQDTLWTLVGALLAHEEAQLHNCTPEDEKLWDMLDEITLKWDDERLSLREIHERRQDEDRQTFFEI